MTLSPSEFRAWRPRHPVITAFVDRVLGASLPQLPAHQRAEHALLTEAQAQQLYDLALQWGDQVVQCEEAIRDMEGLEASIPTVRRRYQDFIRQAESALYTHTVYVLQTKEDLPYYKDILQELMQRARYWVDWRARGAKNHIYGDCRNVSERAAWSLLEYLLTLEYEALESVGG